MSRPTWVLFGLVILPSCPVMAPSLFGSGEVSAEQVMTVLSGGGTGQQRLIVFRMHGFRILIALIANVVLGIAGVLVQAPAHNPLAGSGPLGVNAGIACAVAIGLSLVRSPLIAMVVPVSLVDALVSGSVVTGAAETWRERHNPARAVLVGIVWSTVVSAITTVMLLSDPRVYAEFRFWDVGAVMPWSLDLVTAAAGAPGARLPAALLLVRPMGALTLGEEFAEGLGLAAGRVRVSMALTCLVLCAAAAVLVGSVSFLGLITPFATRLAVGLRHRSLIWFLALLDGVTLLAADVPGRVVSLFAEVQAALMCALLGVLLFTRLARA